MKSTWTTATLGESTEIVSGATPKTEFERFWDGEVAWATPRDLSILTGKFIDRTARNITDVGLQSCSARVLPPNSVLFSSRAPIGHTAINRVPMATNQGFKSFIPRPEMLDANYLCSWLRANRPYLESLGNGATFKEVSKAVIARVELPVPPLSEQRRIAAILDQADTLRTQRRTVLAQLDELKQAIFDEMFATRDGSSDWTPVQFAEVCNGFRYGTSNKSGYSGHPALRIPNVIGGAVNYSEIKTVEVTSAELAHLRLIQGDLLFVRTNGNPDFVGRCANFEPMDAQQAGHDSDVIYASYLIRARLDSIRANHHYVREFMLGPQGRKALRANAKTSAGQFNINIDGIGSVELPLPPLALQELFALRIAAIEPMRAMQHAALTQLDALFASLQHRAFRGEL